MAAQKKYLNSRAEQRERLKMSKTDLDDDTFWKTTSENAPETRLEISQRSRKSKGLDEKPKLEKKSLRLFAKDGRPLNINQAKVCFTFNDDDPKEYVLDVAIYK